jgi:predicted nucleic acid-binding protein
VRKWAETRPAWLRVRHADPEALTGTVETLDPGEREAIVLARLLHADLVIIDERAGRQEARRWNLAVTGTLGVLLAGADRGLVDLRQAVSRLQRTSFYISPGLLKTLLREQ